MRKSFSMRAFIDVKGMRQCILLIELAWLAGNKYKVLGIPGREKRITLDSQFDFCEVEALRHVQKQGVDLLTTHDKGFAVLGFVQREHLISAVQHFDALV